MEPTNQASLKLSPVPVLPAACWPGDLRLRARARLDVVLEDLRGEAGALGAGGAGDGGVVAEDGLARRVVDAIDVVRRGVDAVGRDRRHGPRHVQRQRPPGCPTASTPPGTAGCVTPILRASLITSSMPTIWPRRTNAQFDDRSTCAVMVSTLPTSLLKLFTVYGSGRRPAMWVNVQGPVPFTVSSGTNPFSSSAISTNTLNVEPPERPTPVVPRPVAMLTWASAKLGPADHGPDGARARLHRHHHAGGVARCVAGAGGGQRRLPHRGAGRGDPGQDAVAGLLGQQLRLGVQGRVDPQPAPEDGLLALGLASRPGACRSTAAA